MNTLAIVHGGCPDGWCSAWLIHHALHGHVDIHPAVYGRPPPDPDGRPVIIADFSYPPDQLTVLADNAASVLVLDHHQTAIEALLGYEHPNVELVLDPQFSGAGLTATRFRQELAGYGDADWLYRIDRLVGWVQDIDLWRFNYDESRTVSSMVASYPYTIEAWDQLIAMDEDDIIAAGEHIDRYRDRLIEQAVANARQLTVAGHLVWAAPAPYAIGSFVAGALFEQHGGPFAAYYVDTPTGRQWGLRSGPDGIDVAKLAEQFGGGGHRDASGYREPWVTQEPVQ